MLEVEEKEKENRSDAVDVYSAVMWYRHVPEFPHWDKSETAAVSGNQKWGKGGPFGAQKWALASQEHPSYSLFLLTADFSLQQKGGKVWSIQGNQRLILK